MNHNKEFVEEYIEKIKDSNNEGEWVNEAFQQRLLDLVKSVNKKLEKQNKSEL